jgi:hypothetical protein
MNDNCIFIARRRNPKRKGVTNIFSGPKSPLRVQATVGLSDAYFGKLYDVKTRRQIDAVLISRGGNRRRQILSKGWSGMQYARRGAD